MAIIKNVDRTLIPLDFLGRGLKPGEEVYVLDKVFHESEKLQEQILRKKIRVVEQPETSVKTVEKKTTEQVMPDMSELVQQLAAQVISQISSQMPMQQNASVVAQQVADTVAPLVEMEEKLVIVDKKEDFNSSLSFDEEKSTKVSLKDKAAKLRELKGGKK